MTGTLFRRLVVLALALVALTVWAVDSTLRKKAQVFDNTGLARARAELQTVFIK